MTEPTQDEIERAWAAWPGRFQANNQLSWEPFEAGYRAALASRPDPKAGKLADLARQWRTRGERAGEFAAYDECASELDAALRAQQERGVPPTAPQPASPPRDDGGQRIIDGLNDAIAWVDGDESAARVVHVRGPASPPRENEETRIFDPSNSLPSCMMPDGGDCCKGYQQLIRERDFARAFLTESENERFEAQLLLEQRLESAEAQRDELENELASLRIRLRAQQTKLDDAEDREVREDELVEKIRRLRGALRAAAQYIKPSADESWAWIDEVLDKSDDIEATLLAAIRGWEAILAKNSTPRESEERLRDFVSRVGDWAMEPWSRMARALLQSLSTANDVGVNEDRLCEALEFYADQANWTEGHRGDPDRASYRLGWGKLDVEDRSGHGLPPAIIDTGSLAREALSNGSNQPRIDRRRRK